MTILVSADALLSRRAQERSSPDLAALGAHLDAGIARLLSHPLYVPEAKALLSRWGAHCRDDEAELAFDPFSPSKQRCTRCGREWSTDQAHRWWVYWYQLWLAERVLVMALRSGPGGNAGAEQRAIETLALLVERYQHYPNADNVLGPARPFFSTYLESIWVLQLAAAASTLDGLGRLPAGLRSDLNARLFRPSADLIADFDEGASNRQVWNAAALYALGGVLGDAAMRDRAAHGSSGMLAVMHAGLRADGLWYEGENYHWFVLRGLAWGAQLMRAGGGPDLWTGADEHGTRFREAFRAPVLTALPDFTFPARRDSKFGVSLRQRRMAELWEIANAVAQSPSRQVERNADFYPSLLNYVYAPSIAEGNDGDASITEVERHEAPAGVRRTTLGWKAWLWMTPELAAADADAWRPGTTHLESTGLAIVRRDAGATYVSVDYGEPGGGHGHPDRLHLTSVLQRVPWLLDFGTGSYVAPSLPWYRSTLAHNAPLVDGQSQHPARGRCVAFDERGEYAWICAYLEPDTAFDAAAIQRTVVVTPLYVLDVVQLQSETMDRRLALPWHGLGQLVADEQGLVFTRDEGTLRIHLSARQPFQVLVQRAPGPPRGTGAAPDMDYPIAIANGESVTLAACLDSCDAVQDIDCVDDDFIVRLKDGGVHVHRATEYGWLIEPDGGSPVELEGMRPETDEAPRAPESAASADDAPDAPHPPGEPLVLDRADQFRRAESTYPGANRFSARATVAARDDTLHVDVDVTAPEPWFRARDAENPEWENENPDIHGDGVQVYVDNGGFFGWLVVPDGADQATLRVAAVSGTDAEDAMVMDGAWAMTERGYRVSFDIAFPETITGDFGFDLYVNRGARDRERRTGQLVWSGARGARLYLAGDRALPGPLPRIRVE